MIAIFYALKSEIKFFKRKVLNKKQHKIKNISFCEGMIDNIPVLLVRTGIGIKKAKLAIEITIKNFEISLVISTGFAGALQDKINVGDLVSSKNILYATNLDDSKDKEFTIDDSLEHNKYFVKKINKTCDGLDFPIHYGDTITVNNIIFSAAKKSWLGKESKAIAVDMETFAIADVALNNRLPFFSIRSISDDVKSDLNLEKLGDSLSSDDFNLNKTSWELLKDFKNVSHLMKLRKQSIIASRKISRFIFCFIQTIDEHQLAKAIQKSKIDTDKE